MKEKKARMKKEIINERAAWSKGECLYKIKNSHFCLCSHHHTIKKTPFINSKQSKLQATHFRVLDL